MGVWEWMGEPLGRYSPQDLGSVCSWMGKAEGDGNCRMEVAFKEAWGRQMEMSISESP